MKYKNKYKVTYGGSNENKKYFNNLEKAIKFLVTDTVIDCKYREIHKRLKKPYVNSWGRTIRWEEIVSI